MTAWGLGEGLGRSLGCDLRDQFEALRFTRVWRARDAVDNGSVTTSLPNYIGLPLSLTRQGTGQAIKAASTNGFNGAFSVTCNGNDAAGGYSAVVPESVPSAMTLVWVGRIVGDPAGLSGFTAGGVVLSGESQILNTTLRSSNQNTNEAISSFAEPGNVALVSTFQGAGGFVRHYASRYTPVSVASTLGLAGTTYHAGCRASNASVPTTLSGEMVTWGYARRALSRGEVAKLLTWLGGKYNLPIAA